MVPIEWASILGTSRELKVFLVLCAHANKDGECHPSRKRIADFTGIDERDIVRTLRRLEEIEAITTTQRKDTSSVYRINPPPLKTGGG